MSTLVSKNPPPLGGGVCQAKDYDYSEWYLEDEYYIDGILNQLVVRKNDEWSDTLYIKNNN